MELSKLSVTTRRVFGATVLLPVVLVVWYDQKIGGLMVVILALFMSVEANRITNMPPIMHPRESRPLAGQSPTAVSTVR